MLVIHYCTVCSGRPCELRREPVDIEDRNSHHPLLPGESDQGTVGGSVWCGVTKESLSFHHGESGSREISVFLPLYLD